MKRIITYLFIVLITTASVWPVKGSQHQGFVDLSQYRGARFHPKRVLVKYRGEPHVRRLWLERGEDVLGKLRALANNPWVEYAEPDLIITIDRAPNDGRVDELWGMESIRAFDAWNVTTGSDDVVIAVTDTGIDYSHPDLAANMWRNPGEVPDNGLDDDGNGFIDDYYGWNGEADDGDPMDDNKHGTHVAGTIGAVGDNRIGVAGVNWRLKLMALKFLDATGSGSLSDAIEVIDYAIMMKHQGVNIIAMNASWGSPFFSFALQDAVTRATEAGILFVAAAGNDGRSRKTYPGGFKNVLAVAALDTNGETLADFSSFGDWVDVAAPGTSVLSTIPGGGYARFSGTSMATPHVTGLAGLIASVANLSVSELRRAIGDGARMLPALEGLVATSGTIDAAETLRRLNDGPPTDPPPGENQAPTVALSTSESTVRAGIGVTLTAEAADGDNDPLMFQWQATAGQLFGQDNRVFLDTFDISSPSGEAVQVVVQVSVEDGRGGQARDEVVVTVTPPLNPLAKFNLRVNPSSITLKRGRASFLVQVVPDTDYRGGMTLEPIVLNNSGELSAKIRWRRRRRRSAPSKAKVSVSLLTRKPTASQYVIRVKGTDDFGGERVSAPVIVTLP